MKERNFIFIFLRFSFRQPFNDHSDFSFVSHRATFGITPVKCLETRRRMKNNFSKNIRSLAKKGVTRREIIGGCAISAATRRRE